MLISIGKCVYDAGSSSFFLLPSILAGITFIFLLMSAIRILCYSLCAILVSALLTWLVLSKTNVLTATLLKQLQKSGIPVTSLHIENISTTHLTLNKLVLNMGESLPALTLPKLSLAYDLDGLLKEQKIETLTLSDINYTFDFQSKSNDASTEAQNPNVLATKLAMLTDNDLFKKIPIQTLFITNSTITVLLKSGTITLPVEAKISFDQAPGIHISTASGSLTLDDHDYTLNDTNLTIEASDENPLIWQGKYVGQLTPLQEENRFPPVQLLVDFTISNDQISASLNIADHQKLPLLETSYQLDVKTMMQQVGRTTIHWKKGTITTTALQFKDLENAKLSFKANARQIPLQDFFDLAAGSQIQANGVLNGSLPITLHKGMVSIGQGILETPSSGHLSVAPDYFQSLAQNNPKLESAALALSDFNYERLQIVFTQLDRDKTQLSLAVRGNSDKAYEGRPIHLNVTIGGNLYSLVINSLKVSQLANIITRGVFKHD